MVTSFSRSWFASCFHGRVLATPPHRRGHCYIRTLCFRGKKKKEFCEHARPSLDRLVGSPHVREVPAPMIPLSILDLSPIVEGGAAAQAFRNTLDLARHAERWGYRRYWLAEHHNMPGIASAATAVRDRPRGRRHLDDPRRRGRHHAAEPRAAGDRRAVRHAGVALSRAASTWASAARPGTDQVTARRCAATSAATPTRSRRTWSSCMATSATPQPGQAVRAVPGRGAATCRSGSSARASSARSSRPRSACPTPSPRTSRRPQLMQAIEVYRATFRPRSSSSGRTSCSGFNVFAADTDEEARLPAHLACSRRSCNLRTRPARASCRRRSTGFDATLAPAERAMLDRSLSCSVVGSPDDGARAGSRRSSRAPAPTSSWSTAQIYDHAARLRSFEIAAEVGRTIRARAQG